MGIDHGYGNLKTANTVAQTGISKLHAEPAFSKGVLFYEDSYYLIGEGHKEFISDKWLDSDFYLFTLMGITRELNHEGHHLCKGAACRGTSADMGKPSA